MRPFGKQRLTMQCGAVDSEAVFVQRLSELGLAELRDRLRELGWLSHGNFAFFVTSAPGGVVDEEKFANSVVRPIFNLGAEAALPAKTSAVRRLFFESHALTVGELRHRVERTDSDAPRKVPQAEREARKKTLRARLSPGLRVEGELDPANVVVDRFVAMVDDNTIEWVPWEEVAKRDQEITTRPGQKRWGPDAHGVVKEKTVKNEVHADVGSALKISWALQRRGIAAEVAGLMTFEAHEKIKAHLLTALTREVPDSRFSPPSLEAIRMADKEIWKKLSVACREGVRPASALDPLPADLAVDAVLASLEVNC